MTLGRSELLAPAKRKFRDVETPLGTVRMRSVTERERSQFESDTLDKSGKLSKRSLLTVKPRLIVMCAVDDSGELLFTSADIERLLEMDSITANLLSDEAQKLCGITETDIEELEKNSVAHPEEDSPSD